MPENSYPDVGDLPIDPDTSGDRLTGTVHRLPSLFTSQWDVLLAISAGGALGSLARWGVGELLPWSGTEFAWGTFVENVSGGFALGVLMVFVLDVWPSQRYVRPFLGVGLLGGYTTFSTYMLDARLLLGEGQVLTAFAYLGGSLLAGLLAVWAGIASARLIALRPRRSRRRHPAPPESSMFAHDDDEVRNR
ncbi:CrcB family protein [Nocardioides aquiterrae]|uniref:Fluoride-specific ion channel FluC n=1 Tax=Nocardioides aquiterrae TaxID=203799 RepID=A0ABP4ET37_9ACTN